MALVRASMPGPVGSPGGWDESAFNAGGRLPGPLGFHSIFLADVAAVKVAKAAATLTLAMPAPLGDAVSKYARIVPWPLFGSKGPVTTDIAQGGLSDCPLPTILAAMANTPSGRGRIVEKMVTENKGTVVTDLSALAGKLSDEQPAGNITSQRYFTVTLGGKSIDVSDVFFTDEGDSGWSLRYMQAPGKGAPVLWACVIEKAYAAQLGGYAKLDEMKVNTVWKALMGADPHGFSITDKTPLDKIKEAAEQAGKQPTILASSDDRNLETRSKGKVVDHHGYAVLRLRGNSVDLYNPWGSAVTVSVAEIRLYFQSMFYP